MNAVTLEVAALDDARRPARGVLQGREQGTRISFETPELLFKLLTAKRWEILRAMMGAGAMTIREAARRVSRDVKAVHGDVHALLRAGVLQKTESGKIVFPFDVIHLDVTVSAAGGRCDQPPAITLAMAATSPSGR